MADSLAARIKRSRLSAKLTQTQLGAACGGKSPQAVYKWETGISEPSAADLITIAQLTNTTVAYLMTGKGGDIVSPLATMPGRIVPSIPWPHVLDFVSGIYIPQSSVRSHFDCGPRAFATTVEDPSNAPHILIGDSLIVDPDQLPDPGDYVLARAHGLAVVRRYQPRDAAVHLAAANPDWPSYTLTDWPASMLGTITEIAKPRRR